MRVARLILICESQRFLNIQDYHCCRPADAVCGQTECSGPAFSGVLEGLRPWSSFRILCEIPGCLVTWRSEPAGQQERVRVSSRVLWESQGSRDRAMGDCLSREGCQSSASSLTSPAPGPSVYSVRAFVPRRKLLGSLASPQGTLIQHLKEHILHGNMTSSDIILYYTTVSALLGRALVSSGRGSFIITLLFTSPPWHVSVVRSTAQAAGCVFETPGCVQLTPGCVHETPGCVQLTTDCAQDPRLCARDPRLCAVDPRVCAADSRLCQLTPGCVHLTPGCVRGPQAVCTRPQSVCTDPRLHAEVAFAVGSFPVDLHLSLCHCLLPPGGCLLELAPRSLLTLAHPPMLTLVATGEFQRNKGD